MHKLDFLKNNQEKLFLLLGFILVLSAGFFSGYFYSQEQFLKQEIIIEEPTENCVELFNSNILKESVNSMPAGSVLPVKDGGSNSGEALLQNKTGMFVASKNSNIYHKPDCKYVKRIKDENKIWFRSAGDAKNKGFNPHSCVE